MASMVQTFADTIRDDTRGGVSAHVYALDAGAVGGALGGVVTVIAAMVWGSISGHNAWCPLNLIAALAARRWQEQSHLFLMQFNLGGFFIGAFIYVVIAMLIGLVFVLLLPTLPGRPLLWAFVVGPLMWYAVLFAVWPLLNPVVARTLDMPSFLRRTSSAAWSVAGASSARRRWRSSEVSPK